MNRVGLVLLLISSPALAQVLTCRTCHGDIWRPFVRNPHFENGCESCHGSGEKHMKSPGRSTIVSFIALKPQQVLETCLHCHGQTLPRANIRRSSHTRVNVICTNCHSIHKSASPKFLLAKPQTELCYTCHQDVRSQFEMPFHHRVDEGFMSCADCHNPHGGFGPTWSMGSRPRMLDQAFGSEEPCLKCHSEKRGPFAFEHAPVRVEGCEICHQPHGSPNSRLLRRPVVFTLCLECHNGAGNFGRNSTGVPTQTASHNMADPRYQNCTACHVRIHGSNADATFLR